MNQLKGSPYYDLSNDWAVKR